MKKRLLLFLCIFTLLLSTAAQAEDVTADVPAPAPSAEKADTLSPFARTRSYDGRFTDVDASAWYHDAVAALYEYGLTEGVSSSAYAPEGSVTIAELVTFAARLHALERGAAIPAAAAGEAWYQPYVRYLKAEKCLGDELDGHYPEAATRAQMAGVLASALSAECYDERNAEATAASPMWTITRPIRAIFSGSTNGASWAAWTKTAPSIRMIRSSAASSRRWSCAWSSRPRA